MFKNSASVYDAIYSAKDYARESEILIGIIKLRAIPVKSLLDVACGSGQHISLLKHQFEDVEGLDLEPELLVVARERNPGVIFHQGDMTDFDLNKKYDVVTCLFSAIGYAKTVAKLQAAVKCMSDHMNPGGVLIVEPWFTPDQYIPGTVHAIFVDRPELKVARMCISEMENDLSILDMHYLIGTVAGIERYEEHHEVGLYTQAQYIAAFKECGLAVSYDPSGLIGRGLYIGVKVPETETL